MTEENLASDFWRIVGEPGRPENLKVGTVALLEETRNGEVLRRRLVVITECRFSAAGEPQVVFTEAPDGTSAQPEVVMVVEV